MNETQRAAAERLADELASVHPLHPYVRMCGSAAALLRELLSAETVHRCPACDSAETSDRREWMCNECGEYFEVAP